MNKKKRLNRGLDILLAEQNSTLSESQQELPITTIKINQLIPGQFQPRTVIDPATLEELVASIRTQGILQPLIVRSLSNHSYEIIAGERRWQAAKLADLADVPVIIKNVNDQAALTIALIENIQRANLNPLDEAMALHRLTTEFNLTHNEIATAVGKSRVTISNLLRILQLPAKIKEMLEQNNLDLGHAKVLLSAPENLQLKLASEIIQHNLSVRATEILLKKYSASTSKLASKLSGDLESNVISPGKLLDPDLHRLQNKLSDFLGAKVALKHKVQGNKAKGKLIISYHSLDELEGILQHFNIRSEI